MGKKIDGGTVVVDGKGNMKQLNKRAGQNLKGFNTLDKNAPFIALCRKLCRILSVINPFGGNPSSLLKLLHITHIVYKAFKNAYYSQLVWAATNECLLSFCRKVHVYQVAFSSLTVHISLVFSPKSIVSSNRQKKKKKY